MFIPNSSATPSATNLKETLQYRRERFGSLEAQGVHTRAIQGAVEFRQTFGIEAGKAFAHGATGGIQLQQFPGLGVLDGHEAGIGQLAFTRIVQVQADDVVTALLVRPMFGNDVA